MQDNAAITPVISKSSADFIEGLVKNAEDKGAKLLQPYKREGNLIWPLLIDNVTRVRSCVRRSVVAWSSCVLICGTVQCSAELMIGCPQDMRLAWEEPFGPVVPVVRVKTIEEAVDHCNANNLALQVAA